MKVKASQIYSEGKQVDVMTQDGTATKLTGYFINGSVTEVMQRHSHRTMRRHIVTVTWYESEDFGNEEGTYMDGMRQATYSIPSDAIRECINAIDDCAQWLSAHLSEDALLRLKRIQATTDSNGDPLF